MIIKIVIKKSSFLASNAFSLRVGKNVFILRRCRDKSDGKEINQHAESARTVCGVQVYCLSSTFFRVRATVFILIITFYCWFVNLNDLFFMIDEASREARSCVETCIF